MNKLTKKLAEGNFRKIILGLGNTSIEDIKALGAIYSRAGADMFDLTPDKNVFDALLSGIKSSGLNPDNFFYCVSFSFQNDIHGSKAFINEKLCIKCGKCFNVCPYHAITNSFKIIEDKCIGCHKCNLCNAINFHKKTINPIDKLLELKNYKIDAVELHLNSVSINNAVKIVKEIRKNFPKILTGICLTYDKRPINEVFELINSVQKEIYPQKLIFQADGNSMSGFNEDINSALNAAEFAEKLQNCNIYTIISGGCNSKTKQLLDLKKISVNGIAYGSYARILAEPYMKNSQFWCNIDVMNKAVEKVLQLGK